MAENTSPESKKSEQLIPAIIPDKPFRILSLNGGGMRGIYQAFFLNAIAGRLPEKRFADNFDLIIGTSTGSIIALAIALGEDLSKVTRMYETEGQKIFTPITWTGFSEGARYDAEPLKEALTTVFGDKKLADCKVNVIIPSFTVNDFSARLISNTGRDRNLYAVDAAMASSAGPTYFPAIQPRQHERSYVDGGLWANAPSLYGALVAHLQGVPFTRMRVLAIGNGEVSPGLNPKDYNKKRPWSVDSVKTILDMLFAAQSHSADVFTKALLGDGRVLRYVSINSTLKEKIELDEAPKALSTLKPLAEGQASNRIKEIRRLLSVKEYEISKKIEDLEKEVDEPILAFVEGGAVWLDPKDILGGTEGVRLPIGTQSVTNMLEKSRRPIIALSDDGTLTTIDDLESTRGIRIGTERIRRILKKGVAAETRGLGSPIGRSKGISTRIQKNISGPNRQRGGSSSNSD